jgi:hypothetical protein
MKPAKAKRGRPLKDDDFLAMEVHRVMQAYKCGVRAACKRIARGKKQDRVPLLGGPWRLNRKKEPTRQKATKAYTIGSPWQGTNAGTLEQRYFRWLRREEERQKAHTLKIEFP